MSDKTLRQWSEDQNIPYWTAWRKFHDQGIDGAYKTDSGRIFVKSIVAETLINNTDNKISKIPELKYERISLAEDIQTRSNKSADSEIVNRFHNIDSGILPYSNTTGGGINKSGVTPRDAIILSQKAYFNVAIFRQIIDLIVDLSVGKIFLRGGNKKSRDFIKSFLRKIEIDSFQEKFFLELWRSSNVIIFSYNIALNDKDIRKISTVYGLEESNAQKKTVLPGRFTILNPADVQVASSCMFSRPTFYKILNNYELERLKNPRNDTDKEVLQSLPEDIRKQIRDKKIRSVTLELPAENTLASFYKKMDYEGLAIPVFFPVLDDINWKLQLKKMDMATTRMMNQAILLVTTGTEPDKGGINPQNVTNLQTIFKNESVGRVLIADYTTKAEFIIPSIADILDPKKYEVVNNDIYIGLNYILLQGEKFANKQTALQLFIEKINYGRRLFLNDFLNKVIENVCKEIGFKNYPEAYFEDVKISNKTERDRIITQLAQYGHLTPKEVFEALENGRFPLAEESVENQKDFKEYRDEGYYQPITGGPASQMDLLKETNKNAVKIQQNQHEHDKQENSKQRRHDAENPPPAPPPAIHIGAPVKSLKKPAGRPSGTKSPQTKKKISKIGGSLISGAQVIKNTLLYDRLERDIIDTVSKKYNLNQLNTNQIEKCTELAKIIARNESPDTWLSSIASYIDNPIDKNNDRIAEIEELAYHHQIEQHLASILFASLEKSDAEENEL